MTTPPESATPPPPSPPAAGVDLVGRLRKRAWFGLDPTMDRVGNDGRLDLDAAAEIERLLSLNAAYKAQVEDGAKVIEGLRTEVARLTRCTFNAWQFGLEEAARYVRERPEWDHDKIAWGLEKMAEGARDEHLSPDDVAAIRAALILGPARPPIDAVVAELKRALDTTEYLRTKVALASESIDQEFAMRETAEARVRALEAAVEAARQALEQWDARDPVLPLLNQAPAKASERKED